MKLVRIFLPLVAIFFILSAFNTHKGKTTTTMRDNCKWVDTIKDFGKVKEGPALEYKFLFKNKGKKPLKITSAHPGCSCTVSTFTNTEVKKNKKGEVTAKYETANRLGFFIKYIAVTFEDGTNQSLVIKGEVIPK